MLLMLMLSMVINYRKTVVKVYENKKGAAGVEPATSRSAVECSATELYPQFRKGDDWGLMNEIQKQVLNESMITVEN